MKIHPWEPIILKNTKKILVGTLPPDSARFYFSNSPNTRLWDLLASIKDNKEVVIKGSNELSDKQKGNILEGLNLGITDVIYGFERDVDDSTKDKHIDPKEYRDILKLIEGTEIDEILFVYKNAAKWFLHSLTGEIPVRVKRLKYKIENGTFGEVVLRNRKVKYSLLPRPLNRGGKGETLDFKLDFYRKYIKG